MNYIITTETFPNGLAATQRIKCYAKCLVALGDSCRVLCVNRCEDLSKPLGNTEVKGTIDGYEYSYLGRTTLIQKSWKKQINRLHDTFRLVLMMLFVFSSKDKAIVYSYNPLLLKLTVGCSRIRGFKVFFELNEHPSVLHSLFKIKGEEKDDLVRIRRVLSGLDGVLCISPSLKNLLVKCGIPAQNVHLVNMLVDPSRFIGIKKQDSEPYIAYCGAADNNKDGVDKLIMAFSLISTKYPKLKLYIMGPKNTDCENEQLAKSHGLLERIVFTGIVNSNLMPQMLVNAKVLALARPHSIQAEYGFPTKLGEYLLSGNPVVVTNVGDIGLFLKNGESAYLVEPDNVVEFAFQLDKALSTIEANEIGLKGRIIAMTCFTVETVKNQLREALGFCG